MENDFCRYSVRRFVYLIKYIESVFYSLEIHCISITERLNSLNNRVFSSQSDIVNLDHKKEFQRIETCSIRDFMLLEDRSIVKKSYFLAKKDCERILVLIKENFPKFLNYSSTILDKPIRFSERAIDVIMESSQSKSYEQLFRCQRKEESRIKSKKATNSKGTKISTFRNSLEKLLRIKSRSEKSLKNEDLRLGMAMPQTIYLTPQQTVSLSRDTWYIANEHSRLPPIKQSVRHSCSNYACRRSSTFCMFDTDDGSQVSTKDRPLSPPAIAFCPVNEEEYPSEKVATHHYNSVSHSTSMPAHLSKSHQIVSKSKQTDVDNIRPAKRTARKKGIFNCSLFRKRSNSHSKSVEKINDNKVQKLREKSKSLNRSESNIASIISDRCLTLPNLKSSEVDLTVNLRRQQLLSMDLLKDFINRSNNSLQSSANRNSVDCTTVNPVQPFSSSVHSSPHSNVQSTCKCEQSKFKITHPSFCDSIIRENPSNSESFYAPASASNDPTYSRHSRATSPLTISSSAFDNAPARYSNVTQTFDENQQPPCLRQISAPISYQPSQSSHQYLSSPPPNSAFEFWTRPYHEKMKASRRRLLDDKVGSKEALLRSLSPHNLKANDSNALYDNPYQLHIIPEPMTNSDQHSCQPQSQSPISHSKSFYGAVQYRLPSQDNMFHDYRPHSSTSPVIENRLVESPISVSKRQDTVYRNCGNDYFIYNTDSQNESKHLIFTADVNLQPQIEINRTSIEKLCNIQRKDFEGSFPEIKDNKSVNSSSDLVLTRTPTPPHSFAESSVSSIYPAPTEFISDHTKSSNSKTHKLCGTINLLYANSDNSEDGNDEFDKIELEPIPPVPPPRTDSVLRSLQSQQQNTDTDKSEQEYDISDEFPPVFSGANIDRCDIEQYHKWLEKLPYKISEFPNNIQCRKSTATIDKVSPLLENIDSVSKKIDLLVLKQLKLSRKSIKSWTTSECSKPSDNASISSHGNSSQDSFSMKKSFSYDQCLNDSELQSITEMSPTIDNNSKFPVIDSTLLKQYSHLYSLKPSPQDVSKQSEMNCSILKFNRSKSIDLRNFVNTISGTQLSEQCLENISQKRKSVPNTKFNAMTKINDISGKSNQDMTSAAGSDFKVYPMV